MKTKPTPSTAPLSDEERRRGLAIALLCESFGRKATDITFAAYEAALDDIPAAAVEAAVRIALKTSRFMPAAAELRELCGQVRDDDRPTIAWLAVCRAVPLGPYKHIDFDDPATNAAIRALGGWPSFLAKFTTAEEEGWAKKEFEKTYRAIARSGVSAEAGKPLVGLSHVSVVDGEVVAPIPRRIKVGLPAPVAQQSQERIESKKRPAANLPPLAMKKP